LGIALERAVDRVFCLGAETPDQLWLFCERQARVNAHLRWTSEALDFSRSGLRKHGGLVARLLAVRIAAWQREQAASKQGRAATLHAAGGSAFSEPQRLGRRHRSRWPRPTRRARA